MDKKIALVTGANRGIGLGIVHGLVRQGFHVLMGVRNLRKGEVSLASLDSDQAEILELDVCDSRSLIKASEWVKGKYGRLDVLINNAGIIGENQSNFRVGDISEIRDIMEVNYFGPMQVNAAFLPLLQRSDDPRIINVSSGMGELASLTGGYAGYRLSKAGLNAQTMLLANELKGEVKVFALCPGWVKTDMGGQNAPRSVEEGADTAVWLASDENAQTGKFYRDRKVIPW